VQVVRVGSRKRSYSAVGLVAVHFAIMSVAA
jgi:hypothetical protein